ncbi:MAG: alpha/beta hydrolase [Saprospiraceae bacterium]|nr:alpha/beta hydrolase [Saprospiraceae bacterium]
MSIDDHISKHLLGHVVANELSYVYIRKGEKHKKAILFIHGFPDLANTWDDTIEILSEEYDCIAPFLTGYYPSQIPKDGNYSPKRVAEDMAVLMKKLGIKKYIVVGHDWGASVAYALANLYPKRVIKLVSVAIPHPRFIKPSLQLFYRARHFFALRSEKSSQFAKKNNYAYIDKLYQRWAPNWKDYKETSDQVKEVLAMPGRFEAVYGYYWTFNKNLKNKELNRLMGKKPTMPFLVFAGKTDGALVLKQFYKMKESMGTQVRLAVHETAGHFPHREAPDFFLRELKAFLAEAVSKGKT